MFDHRFELFDGIKLFGCGAFISASQRALELLQASVDYQAVILPNASMIGQYWSFAPVGSAYIYLSLTDPRVVFNSRGISQRAEEYFPEKIALTICHEAYHNQIYRECLSEGGRRLYKRRHISHHIEHERRCVQYQLDIGSELRMDEELLDYHRVLLRLMPHSDLPLVQQRDMRNGRNLVRRFQSVAELIAANEAMEVEEI